MFDLIAGLPLHPLVVHVAVIILPLSALGLIAIIAIPRWRGGPLGWVVMGGLVVGAGAAFVAKESGEALAKRVGEPQDHASLGDILPFVALLLLVVAIAWFVLQRRAARESGRGSVLVAITAAASVLLALAATGLTIAVGHSGAEAVWSGRVASEAAAESVTPSATPSATGGSTATGGTTSGTSYTLAQVQQHASAADCWAVVDGSVYNLTDWIGQHPGGPGVIEGMCGIDATSAFTAQHGSQGEPNQELASFLVGTLAAPSSSATPTAASPSPTPSATASDAGLTMAAVRKHASPSDCWTVIDGTVYDLTDWIAQHPGGPGAIETLCGTDATSAFAAQHGSQREPNQVLAGFELGPLAA